MKALSSYIRKNSCSVRYFLKTDIKGFYEHINPNILKEKFRRIIKDKLFLKAIYWIIDNNRYALPTGEVVSKGLTIGAYSSQWFANFYLQDFDHYVKEQLGAKFYIRYMDDMIILDSNKKHLHEIKKKMIEFLDKEKLFFKPNYTVQKLNYTKPDGKVSGSFIEFIGYRSLFYRATRLARRVHEHIKKVKKLLKKDASAVVAYYGWFKHADCYKAYQKYISPIISINACKRLIGYLARYKKRKGVRVLNNEDEG